MAAPGLLVLWDIDHTLLNAGGLSAQLYEVVFAELFGRELTEAAPRQRRDTADFMAATV